MVHPDTRTTKTIAMIVIDARVASHLRFTTQYLQHVSRRQPGCKAEGVILQLRGREPRNGGIDHEVYGMTDLDVVCRDERIRRRLDSIESNGSAVPVPVLLMRDHEFVFTDIFSVKRFHGLSRDGRKRLRYRVDGNCLGVSEQGSWLLKLGWFPTSIAEIGILPVPGKSQG